jgi:hypothetical protein
VGNGFREEVINVVLAQLLNERGLVSAPEVAIQDPEAGRRLPDVMVVFHGLRTVIEGKVEGGDAEARVMEQAVGRVEEGIAHIGIAVVYPNSLRSASFSELPQALADADLRIAVCTEGGTLGWVDADLDYLGNLLRRALEDIVEEDVVAYAVGSLNAGVDGFARAAGELPGLIDRAADVLGIAGPPG